MNETAKPLEKLAEPKKPRRCFRICFRSLLAIIVLLSVATITAKNWLIPSIIRQRIQQACSHWWDGSVRIEKIDFDTSGEVRLHGVRLLDGAGRLHASSTKIVLQVEDLTGQPIVTDATVHGLRWQLHFEGSRLVLPVRRVSSNPKSTDLNSLRIPDASVIVVRDGREDEWTDRLSVDVSRRGESYQVNLEAAGDGERPDLLLSASIETGDNVLRIEGDLRTDAETIVEGFTLTVGRSQSRPDAYTGEYHIPIEAGTLGGSVSIAFVEGQPIKLAGRVGFEKLDLAKLPQSLSAAMTKREGHLTADLSYWYEGGSEAGGFRADGRLLLEDVQARQDPLGERLFAMLNGMNGPNGTTSTIEADFSLRGPVATIQRALLTDQLSVMKVEPGGTIDLQTRQIDLYVVTIQVRGFSSLLTRIPVVNLATILANKLTRVHVTGTWDNQTLTKEPVEDITSATKEVLLEVGRMSSGVTSPIRRAFGNIFELLKNAPSNGPSTQEAPNPDERR